MKNNSVAEISLRQKALNALARREHSRRDLFRKLTPLAANDLEVNQLLDELEQEGLLSDQRTAEAIVRARENKQGFLKIKQDLLAHGLAEELIGEVLGRVKNQELTKAREVWAKRFSALPSTAEERAKQGRYLANRGFTVTTIQAVLRGDDWVD